MSTTRGLRTIILVYLSLLFAVVGSLMVWPFSKPLNYTLFALLGLFFFAAVLAFSQAVMLVVTRGEGLGMLQYARARIAAARINRLSWAPDSIDVRLTDAKLRKLRPELYESGGNPLAWLDRLVGYRATTIFCIGDHLKHGDSRSAVVVSVEPLLVAAYADELDCIAVLRFPDFLARDYDLHVRDRLLTVNRYALGGPIAADLEQGSLSSARFTNFFPIIADFLTDDLDTLRWRRQKIGEDEWRRTWVLAQRYREKYGDAARDGRPFFSFRPAAVGPGAPG